MKGVYETQVPSDNDILLGEGIYYLNFVDIDNRGTVLGATRGGSKLEIEKKIREMAYDGAYGKSKNLRRYERYVPRFMVTLLKMTYETLAYGTSCDVTDKGDYHEMRFRVNIEDTDYIDNITFVGVKHDGMPCVITLENVLNDGNIEFDFKEKDEITSELQYTAHYLSTAMATPPIKIWEFDTI